MPKLSTYKWIILFIGLIFIAILLIFWLIPTSQVTHQNTNQSPDMQGSVPFTQPPTSSVNKQQATAQSASQADTEINCQLSIDANQNLIIDEKTKNCFEYFISQYGEKNLDQLKNDFNQYIQSNFKEPTISQTLDLWARYLQYRSQLSHLQKPELSEENSAYFRKIFADILQLKKRYFSLSEIEGLFNTESIYHQYTLDRLDIYTDKNLNEAEKAKKLHELLATLPEDWQENIKQLNQLEDLRKLTHEIKNKGGTAEEIREMRLNLVGAEATQRLEQLDQQRNQWKIRVTNYLNQRDNLLNSTMSDRAKHQAIEQLKNQSFPNESDRTRVETFEILNDQGQSLPFPD